MTTALKHPLLKEGGFLAPLVASLAQWHLIDDPEQGLGLRLTEALKATLREADGLKRALGQVSRRLLCLSFCVLLYGVSCLALMADWSSVGLCAWMRNVLCVGNVRERLRARRNTWGPLGSDRTGSVRLAQAMFFMYAKRHISAGA